MEKYRFITLLILVSISAYCQDGAGGRVILQDVHHGAVSVLAVNANGTLLLSGSSFQEDSHIMRNPNDFMPDSSPSWLAGSLPPEVKVWDVASGTLLFSLTGADSVDDFFLSGGFFLAGGKSVMIEFNTMTAWNIFSGKREGGIIRTYDEITDYSPDNDLLIGYSESDGEIRVYDRGTGAVSKTVKADLGKPALLTLIRKGTELLAVTGKELRVYSTASLRLEKTVPLQVRFGSPGYIAFARDREYRLTDEEETVSIVDFNTGERIARIPVERSAHDFRISDNGEYVSYTPLAGEQYMLLSVRERKNIETHGALKSLGTVTTFAFSDGGKKLAGHGSIITFLAYLPDGKLLSSSYDRTARILKTYPISFSFEPRDLSPDGKYLVLGDMEGQMPGELEVMDLTTGKPVFQKQEYNFQNAFFNADNQTVTVFNHLVEGIDTRKAAVEIWNFKTGKNTPVSSFSWPYRTILDGCARREGKLAACMCADGVVRIVDMTNGKALASFIAAGGSAAENPALVEDILGKAMSR
jgi:WD40 repeat protein